MDAHTMLAYQCECPDCSAEPGALCERITTRTTMGHGRVHDGRLRVALELHRSRHPAGSHPNDPACPRCGQLSTAFDVICDPCRAGDRADQGAQDRLFTPIAPQLAGQGAFDL